MTSSPSSPAERLVAAAGRVAGAVADNDFSALGDDALLSVLAEGAEARKAVELIVASASAEVAKRSARELGYGGLAQRKGHRNVTSLVQHITGQSRGDVAQAVKTGEELAPPVVAAGERTDAGAPPVARWLSTLREALATGRISQAQFHASARAGRTADRAVSGSRSRLSARSMGDRRRHAAR